MSVFPSVSIVILNWNGKHHLEKFLPSVLATDFPGTRIIIADNHSTDDSVAFLKANFPFIELILLETNFGFAGGYNRALSQVESDYFVLLNSDVEVKPGWLTPLIDKLEKDASHAAAQPKLLSYSDPKVFEYAGASGGWLDLFGYPFARGRIFNGCEEDKGQYDDASEIFWATGAALVIRSRVFHEFGGFDEYFFAHQEEIDLCWRIHLGGYKIFCCPQSVVYHVGGGTLPRGHSKKTYLNFRNNHIMLAKNLPWKEKWWKIPFRLFLDQLSAFKGLLTGDAGYFTAIISAQLAYLNWLLRHQKKNYPYRRKSLDQLPGVFKGNVVWEHFMHHKEVFSELFTRKAKEPNNL